METSRNSSLRINIKRGSSVREVKVVESQFKSCQSQRIVRKNGETSSKIVDLLRVRPDFAQLRSEEEFDLFLKSVYNGVTPTVCVSSTVTEGSSLDTAITGEGPLDRTIGRVDKCPIDRTIGLGDTVLSAYSSRQPVAALDTSPCSGGDCAGDCIGPVDSICLFSALDSVTPTRKKSGYMLAPSSGHHLESSVCSQFLQFINSLANVFNGCDLKPVVAVIAVAILVITVSNLFT
jgi:hypothetical protein